jgi:hypothetical protein
MGLDTVGAEWRVEITPKAIGEKKKRKNQSRQRLLNSSVCFMPFTRLWGGA